MEPVSTAWRWLGPGVAMGMKEWPSEVISDTLRWQRHEACRENGLRGRRGGSEVTLGLCPAVSCMSLDLLGIFLTLTSELDLQWFFKWHTFYKAFMC